MLSFSKDELKDKPEVHAGDRVFHEACGEYHELQPALSSGEPDDALLWFRCGGNTYIGAVDNKWLW